MPANSRSADDTTAWCAVASKIENAYLKILATHLQVSGEFKTVSTNDRDICLAASVLRLHRRGRRVVEDRLRFDVRIELEVDKLSVIVITSGLDSCYSVLVYLGEKRSGVLSSSELWHYLDSLFPSVKPAFVIPIHIC